MSDDKNYDMYPEDKHGYNYTAGADIADSIVLIILCLVVCFLFIY